jgi:hypothetical protein
MAFNFFQIFRFGYFIHIAQIVAQTGYFRPVLYRNLVSFWKKHAAFWKETGNFEGWQSETV